MGRLLQPLLLIRRVEISSGTSRAEHEKLFFKTDQNSQVKLVSCDEGDQEEPRDDLDRPWPCWNTLGDSGVVPAGLSRRL